MNESTITINNIQLWGYHGCLKEERITGTKYVIDFLMKFDTSKAEYSDDINDTIDYSKIYNIIIEEFKTPVNLIEFLGRNILNAIKLQFPQITESSIKIKKYNPPLYKFRGFVEITINNP